MTMRTVPKEYLTRRRGPQPRRGPWKAIVLGLVLVVLVAFGTLGTGVTMFLNRISTPLPVDQGDNPPAKPTPGERVNILLLGLDDDKLRSDTMILVSMDPEKKKVGVLSIPRDTRVPLAVGPGEKAKTEKITHAYAYGVGDKKFPGPARSMKTVEDWLGVPVHYYVRVDFEGFKKVVDLLGGVEMDISEPMKYEDKEQNLKIDLPAGRQLLDGEKAIQFVRYRSYRNADLGRIEAQQRFLKALMDKMFRIGSILKLPAIAGEAAQYVETNIEPTRMISLARLASNLPEDSVEFGTVVTRDVPGEAYLEPNNEATQKLIDRLIRGIDPAYSSISSEMN